MEGVSRRLNLLEECISTRNIPDFSKRLPSPSKPNQILDVDTHISNHTFSLHVDSMSSDGEY